MQGHMQKAKVMSCIPSLDHGSPSPCTESFYAVKYNPSGHMAFIQRRINVDATPYTTLYIIEYCIE